MRLSKCGPNDAMEEILEQGMQSSGGVRMSRVYVYRVSVRVLDACVAAFILCFLEKKTY